MSRLVLVWCAKDSMFSLDIEFSLQNSGLLVADNGTTTSEYIMYGFSIIVIIESKIRRCKSERLRLCQNM